jgi:hypothetical protein
MVSRQNNTRFGATCEDGAGGGEAGGLKLTVTYKDKTLKVTVN